MVCCTVVISSDHLNAYSEDEHQLIAQYCQSLNGGPGKPLTAPRSPVQIMVAIDAEQREELEAMIR
jgi:hypothetical protein